MGLLDLSLKTPEHKKLAELLWVRNLTGSVHEFSLLSGLPYATAHEWLQKMKDMGLVRKTVSGRATLFSSCMSSEDVKTLTFLLGLAGKEEKKKPLTDFSELDLPLVGDFPELNNETAQNREELLVKVVALSKRNATLLRVLPLLAFRLGPELDKNQLVYWSKQYHVDRELGFTLDLTANLSHVKKFSLLAKVLKDKRWAKEKFFLENEQGLKGFQAQLVKKNTPELAKKWFLSMNVGFDAFASTFRKFAG